MTKTERARYPFTIVRERLRARGGDVLDFALGRQKQKMPAALQAVIESNIALATRRRTQDEVDTFADRAAAMLDRDYGVRVEPAGILPAPGGRAAMSGLVSSLLAPGDGVLVTEPGYPAFAPLARAQHAHIHEVELDPENAFAPDVDAIAPDALAGVRIASLNYPNNPTGAELPLAALKTLGARLPAESIFFNDAIYAPLTYEGTPRSMLAWSGRPEVLELHGLGKLFHIGPLAISFLAGPESLIGPIRDYSDFAWPQLSSLQLELATRCVDDVEHVRALRDTLAERVTRLRAVLEELGFDPYPTPAGQYVLCPVPASIRGTPVTDAQHAADMLLDGHGLAVMPWETERRGYVRFSALYLPDELDRLRELAPLRG